MANSSKHRGHRDMQDGRGLQNIQNERWEWKARLGWFSPVKVLASKPDDLNSIPRTYIVEGEGKRESHLPQTVL